MQIKTTLTRNVDDQIYPLWSTDLSVLITYLTTKLFRLYLMTCDFVFDADNHLDVSDISSSYYIPAGNGYRGKIISRSKNYLSYTQTESGIGNLPSIVLYNPFLLPVSGEVGPFKTALLCLAETYYKDGDPLPIIGALDFEKPIILKENEFFGFRNMCIIIQSDKTIGIIYSGDLGY